VIEGEFEDLLKKLTPTKALFSVATEMLKKWWSHIEQSQKAQKTLMDDNTAKLQ